jgi:hypothetical protein
MPFTPVPDAFQPLSPMETNLHAELTRLPGAAERIIRVSASPGGNAAMRGSFLRWFLLEAIPSADLSITRVEIEGAAIEQTLDLEGATLKLLLRFITCTFSEKIKLADAVIIGFEMIGGSAGEIAADRVTVKGSLKLTERYAPNPVPGPRLAQLRLCGAEIRGNLDMRGCTLQAIRNDPDTSREPDAPSEPGEKTEPHGKQDSPPLFADGLTVHGNVLLSGGFKSNGELRLNGCVIDRNLDCSGASLSNPGGYSLSAAGAHIKGTAYFSETPPWTTYPKQSPFMSNGTIRLEGAVIDGDLNCTAGTFLATAFLAGQPDPPEEDDLYAIAADSLKVGSDILFEPGTNNPFSVRGVVSLISAQVGGDFSCRNAIFDFPGEEPLSADGIVVGGTTFLDEAEINGIVRFVQANLKQGFYLTKTTFDTTKGCKHWSPNDNNIAAIELDGPSCGVYAPNAEVGGLFWFEKVRKLANTDPNPNPFWLYIPGSKATSIQDDEASWAALDRFDVMGCQYDTFVGLGDAEANWRLRELDRQYASMNIKPGYPDIVLASLRLGRRFDIASLVERVGNAVKQFKPQHYIQLADVFRAAGYQAAARKVLVRLERNKTRYSDIGFLGRFWRYMLDIFLRYGHSPFRPVLIILAWAALSAAWFQSGYDSKQIIASKDNQATPTVPEPNPSPRTAFNAIIYSIDTLVPIVDLNQKKNWTIASFSSHTGAPVQQSTWLDEIDRFWQTMPNQWLGLLLIFNTFFGWLMTTLFAAGVSGLLRTGKDS